MGIRYGKERLRGSRLYDFEIFKGSVVRRLYSLLDYTKFTLLIFGDRELKITSHKFLNVIQVYTKKYQNHYWSNETYYKNQGILVRPDSYIASDFVIRQF